MPAVEIYDPHAQCARRIKRGDRIVVLPPADHGNVWVGGNRRTAR